MDVVADGCLNAVVFWFDLHLDAEATLTNAPAGIGKGGALTVPGEEWALVPVGEPSSPSSHHWGQALQNLDRAVEVSAGQRVTMLYAVEGERLRFSLREGEGDWVAKPPWLVTWGGGSSVESPHFQRVHYCTLLVNEMLQRVPCRRFPPIARDLRRMLAHCGSLLLDPAALAEVLHELVLLETFCLLPEQSPYASTSAVSKPVALLH